jgi:predicted flap endonuclease-1-like 5' DNA nuclease
MLYVAGEILIWMALAFALGILVGWLVWGYRSKAEAAKAQADIEQAVAAARLEADKSKAQVQELLAARASDADTISRLQVGIATATANAGDAPGLRARVVALEAQLAAAAEERAEAEERAGAAEDILEDHEGWHPVGEIPGMERAHDVLGKPVILDDLKVVEGIGPRIEEVLHGAGISSWAKLAATNPGQLATVLAAAGPELQVHDPSTWPQQAVLALGGRRR